jgi:N-hydroxyarylamine O-acetyltransferase
MDGSKIDAYLARIGASRTSSLRDLQLHHLRTVPFENLSIHLGEEIRLDEDSLVEKIVDRRRGGFCYELNGAFAVLLSGLGYGVELLAARTIAADGLGVPYDHLALRVDHWLVDVGFGSFTHYPLRLDDRSDQTDPAGTFRITPTAEGDLDVAKDGVPEYRIELRPRTLRDFITGCWWHQTSPASHFTRSLVCSRLTAEGRITLGGRTLTRTVAGTREQRQLTDAEVLGAYRIHFGIELNRIPEVRTVRRDGDPVRG